MKGPMIVALAGLAAVAAACQPGAEATVAECRRLIEEDPDAAAEMMDAMMVAMMDDSLMGERMVGRMMGRPAMRGMMMRHMMADPETRGMMMRMMEGGMGPGMMGPGGRPGAPGAEDTAAGEGRR